MEAVTQYWPGPSGVNGTANTPFFTAFIGSSLLAPFGPWRSEKEMSSEPIGIPDRASLARNRSWTLSFTLKLVYASKRGANDTVLARPARTVPVWPARWKSPDASEGGAAATVSP